MTVKKNVLGLISYNKELNYAIKEALQDALILLMKEKQYRSISITELCKKAGVSRMAFYNNYKCLDDVLKSKILDVNHEIINEIGSPFRRTINLDWYISLFYTVRKYSGILTLMFDASFRYGYLEMINDLVLHNVKNISLEEKNKRILWAGGIVNRINKWIDDELLESPEELAEFCYKNLKFDQ